MTTVSFAVLSILNIVTVFHAGVLVTASAISNGGTPALVTVVHSLHQIVVSVL